MHGWNLEEIHSRSNFGVAIVEYNRVIEFSVYYIPFYISHSKVEIAASGIQLELLAILLPRLLLAVVGVLQKTLITQLIFNNHLLHCGSFRIGILQAHERKMTVSL